MVDDDEEEDDKEDDDMAPIAVCLSSYCCGVRLGRFAGFGPTVEEEGSFFLSFLLPNF